jgi:hypothetical protein
MGRRSVVRRMGRGRRPFAAVIAGVVVVVAVTIGLVSFALATTAFPDVSPTNPYYTAITELAGKGVVSGFDNGNFGPDQAVKRQQFAKMIVLAGDYPVSESDVCPFTDVLISGPGSFFPDNYIAVCAAKGITVGKTPTRFDPYSEITRLQVVSMVVRAALDLAPAGLSSPPSTWQGNSTWESDPTHGTNVRRAEYNGLLDGLNLAALSPNGLMTRGEVAQVLYNLIQALTPPTTTTTHSTTSTTVVSSTTTSSTTSSTTTTTNPIAGYESLGGGATSGPAVASWGINRLDVFFEGPSAQLMHKKYDGDWGTVWEDLGGKLATDSRPAVVAAALNPLDVFVRGADNSLWYLYSIGGGWSDWQELDGTMTLSSAPAALTSASGHIEVFARGPNGALYGKTYSSNMWWPWYSMGGNVKAGSDPAAISWGLGRMDVFIRGTDNALWHIAYDYPSWGSWESLGGNLTTSPAVASTSAGNLEVFVGGPGNTVWHRSFSYLNGTWTAWENLGGAKIGSAPAAVSWGPKRIDLFVASAGYAILHKWWNGTTWLP